MNYLIEGHTKGARVAFFFWPPLGESDIVTEECSRRPWLNEEYLPEHLRIGETFWWKITILAIRGLPPHYTSVFCQFSWVTSVALKGVYATVDIARPHFNIFLFHLSLPCKPDEVYSTEPVENTKKGEYLEFCQIQKVNEPHKSCLHTMMGFHRAK